MNAVDWIYIGTGLVFLLTPAQKKVIVLALILSGFGIATGVNQIIIGNLNIPLGIYLLGMLVCFCRHVMLAKNTWFQQRLGSEQLSIWVNWLSLFVILFGPLIFVFWIHLQNQTIYAHYESFDQWMLTIPTVIIFVGPYWLLHLVCYGILSVFKVSRRVKVIVVVILSVIFFAILNGGYERVAVTEAQKVDQLSPHKVNLNEK